MLDGANKIDNLVKKIKQLGMNSVAITDHGNMFGAIEFYTKMRDVGIKPIIGIETYIHNSDKLDDKTKNVVKNIINNHYLSSTLPEDLPDYLNGRTMIVKKAEPIKLECVVRGYLTGSGWKSYSKTGKVSGIELPEGLKNGSMLPKPIFTPTTKAESGHDMQLTHEEAEQLVGKEVFEFLKQKSIELYNLAHEYALSRGLVLADTKFEFGYIGNTSVENILLIDEALTPDSSRYWLKEDYDNGNLTSLDKQFLRDYLETLDWNKMPPPPKLPGDVINNTSRRYKQLYKMITSKDI